MENIGPIGAFVIPCKDSLPVGESFRMIIKPPNQKPLRITAEVIWTTVLTPATGEQCPGMGVQFIRISECDSQFLHNVNVMVSAFIL